MVDYGRYVAIHLEVTLGTDYSANIATFDYFDVLSESIGEDNSLLPVEAASRERRRFQLGGFETGGDMQIVMDMNTIGRLLYGVLGGAHYGDTAKQHLLYPTEDIPTFNVTKGLGGTFVNNAMWYCKAVINSLNMEFSAGSNPTVTVG